MQCVIELAILALRMKLMTRILRYNKAVSMDLSDEVSKLGSEMDELVELEDHVTEFYAWCLNEVCEFYYAITEIHRRYLLTH